MCPACLASAIVLLSGGAFSALLVFRSKPDCDESLLLEGEDHDVEDHLAG